jgi:hypothetical protein
MISEQREIQSLDFLASLLLRGVSFWSSKKKGKIKTKRKKKAPFRSLIFFQRILTLVHRLVRNSQFLSSFATTRS